MKLPRELLAVIRRPVSRPLLPFCLPSIAWRLGASIIAPPLYGCRPKINGRRLPWGGFNGAAGYITPSTRCRLHFGGGLTTGGGCRGCRQVNDGGGGCCPWDISPVRPVPFRGGGCRGCGVVVAVQYRGGGCAVMGCRFCCRPFSTGGGKNGNRPPFLGAAVVVKTDGGGVHFATTAAAFSFARAAAASDSAVA